MRPYSYVCRWKPKDTRLIFRPLFSLAVVGWLLLARGIYTLSQTADEEITLETLMSIYFDSGVRIT